MVSTAIVRRLTKLERKGIWFDNKTPLFAVSTKKLVEFYLAKCCNVSRLIELRIYFTRHLVESELYYYRRVLDDYRDLWN